MSVTWLAWAGERLALERRVGADVDGQVEVGLGRAERVAVVGRAVGVEVLAAVRDPRPSSRATRSRL